MIDQNRLLFLLLIIIAYFFWCYQKKETEISTQEKSDALSLNRGMKKEYVEQVKGYQKKFDQMIEKALDADIYPQQYFDLARDQRDKIINSLVAKGYDHSLIGKKLDKKLKEVAKTIDRKWETSPHSRISPINYDQPLPYSKDFVLMK